MSRGAWAAGLTAATAVGGMVYAVRGRSSSLFAPSVYRGDRNRRAIALTFDDGPSESTPALLEILDKRGIAATFFQVGANVRRLPRVAREVAEAGHEIGNHTDTHPMLCRMSPGGIRAELHRAQTSIEDVTGVRPKLFRAPYGVRWFGLREAQRRMDLLGVMWTAIGLDWKLSSAAIAARLAAGAGNGAILCLHDGRITQAKPNVRATLDAVALLAPMLIDKGYHFEGVSEILCPTT